VLLVHCTRTLYNLHVQLDAGCYDLLFTFPITRCQKRGILSFNASL